MSPEETVELVFTAGQARWPQLTLAREQLREHLQAIGADGLREQHAADVYLACACLQGEAAALEAFEQTQLLHVGAHLASLRLSPSQAAEVQQDLRVKLLAPPDLKLRSYSGRGALRTFVRTSAVNTALHLLERADQRLRKDVGEEWFAELAATSLRGEEAALVKRLDRGAFREAVQAALGQLSAEERNLLRFHYLDGMTVDKIGALRGVHKSTVSRDLKRLRGQLLQVVQRLLHARCRLAADEVESLAQLVGSQLDLSLSRILAASPGG